MDYIYLVPLEEQQVMQLHHILIHQQLYQMVKDLRNNLENTDPERVLDGNIDDFLEAALYQTKKSNK